MNDQFVTKDEAAKLLDISKSTVDRYRIAWTEKLEPFKIRYRKSMSFNVRICTSRTSKTCTRRLQGPHTPARSKAQAFRCTQEIRGHTEFPSRQTILKGVMGNRFSMSGVAGSNALRFSGAAIYSCAGSLPVVKADASIRWQVVFPGPGAGAIEAGSVFTPIFVTELSLGPDTFAVQLWRAKINKRSSGVCRSTTALTSSRAIMNMASSGLRFAPRRWHS